MMPNNENEIFYIVGAILTILVNVPEIIRQININLKFNEAINHHKILWLGCIKKALRIILNAFFLQKLIPL